MTRIQCLAARLLPPLVNGGVCVFSFTLKIETYKLSLLVCIGAPAASELCKLSSAHLPASARLGTGQNGEGSREGGGEHQSPGLPPHSGSWEALGAQGGPERAAASLAQPSRLRRPTDPTACDPRA